MLAEHLVGRAVSAARPLGHPPLTAAAVAMLAFADAIAGAGERAQAAHSEAAALVDALPDDKLALRLDAGAWLAAAECHLDRYAEADPHARRALTLGRTSGQGEVLFALYQILAWPGTCAGSRETGRSVAGNRASGARRRKVDVSSRAGLARAVERADRTAAAPPA